MKTIKIFIAILAISVSAAKAQFVKAELQVSGLTCSMCSKATEKSLRTLPFISDIKPDLNRNLFIITFNSAAPVNLEQIGKKVQSAGFAVNQLKTTINFDKLKLSDNKFNYSGDTYQVVNAGVKSPEGVLPVTIVSKGLASAATLKKYNNVTASQGNGKVYQVIL